MNTRLLILFVCLSLANICLGQASPPSAYEELRVGRQLKPAAAAKLEATVAAHPDDRSARTTLLGYYFGLGPFSKEGKELRAKHVLWFIKNHPEAAVASHPEGGLNAIIDKDAYIKGKALWLEQTKAYAGNTTVLGNAAYFFLIHDPELAQDFLEQAQKAEPDNPKWADKLGQLHSLGGNAGKESASKALAAYEKAQAADGARETRFYRMANLAKQAFAAGEDDKAAKYAAELLETAGAFPRDWNYGNAIHDGNMVLGRVALKHGDANKAGEHLLKAGQTPGSPQLGSFGPNMSLAKDLLEKGEKDVVVKYFTLCGKFWGMGAARLDEWKKQVADGKTPEFGGNMSY